MNENIIAGIRVVSFCCKGNKTIIIQRIKIKHNSYLINDSGLNVLRCMQGINTFPESEGIIIVIFYLHNQSGSKQLDCTVKA